MEKGLSKTKGLIKYLTENGHTVEETQREWDLAVKENVGGLVAWLNKHGYDWRYLQTYQIDSLFGLAERTIAQREAEEEQEKIKEMEELRKKEKETYIKEHYAEYILNKIDTGKELTESELHDMLWRLKQVSEIEGEERRWTRSIRTIFEINGRYFALDWDRGLTVFQENEFWNQPYEVEKKEYTKTIIVTEWERKGDK